MRDLKWAEDADRWDHETGDPGIGLFANALQVWSILQDREGVTIGEAALAFNVSPSRIAEAIDWHGFLYRDALRLPLVAQVIEHDGE